MKKQLNLPKQFIRRGVSRYLLVKSIADPENPTKAEIEAGTDITCAIAGVNGWGYSRDMLSVPNACSMFDTSLPAGIKVDDSSLVFHEDRENDEIIVELGEEGDRYFPVFCPKGVGDGKPITIYQTQYAGLSRNYNLSTSEHATIEAKFAHVGKPIETTYPAV